MTIFTQMIYVGDVTIKAYVDETIRDRMSVLGEYTSPYCEAPAYVRWEARKGQVFPSDLAKFQYLCEQLATGGVDKYYLLLKQSNFI